MGLVKVLLSTGQNNVGVAKVSRWLQSSSKVTHPPPASLALLCFGHENRAVQFSWLTPRNSLHFHCKALVGRQHFTCQVVWFVSCDPSPRMPISSSSSLSFPSFSLKNAGIETTNFLRAVQIFKRNGFFLDFWLYLGNEKSYWGSASVKMTWFSGASQISARVTWPERPKGEKD